MLPPSATRLLRPFKNKGKTEKSNLFELVCTRLECSATEEAEPGVGGNEAPAVVSGVFMIFGRAFVPPLVRYAEKT